MPIGNGSILRWLVTPYSPCPTAREFADAVVTQQRDDLEVRVTVLGSPASRKFFGVPMARRGIQPVWVHVVNRSDLLTGSSSWRSTQTTSLRSKPQHLITTRAGKDYWDSAS